MTSWQSVIWLSLLLTLSACAPAKKFLWCHNDNPYTCDAKEDPSDETRVSVGIACMEALLNDNARFHEMRDQ